MRKRDGRLAAGLLVGTFVAALGPILTAVAYHSGNGSGNEPLDLRSASRETVIASATWVVDEREYSIEVRRESAHELDANGSEQRAERSYGGTITARGYECTYHYGCVPHTWTGRLTSPYANGSTLVADPTLSYARFDGWTREGGTGAGCRFVVEWFGEGVPGSTAGWTVERHRSGVEAEHTPEIERPARASVASNCWGADAAGDWTEAPGRLVAGRAISAAVSQGDDTVNLCRIRRC